MSENAILNFKTAVLPKLKNYFPSAVLNEKESSPKEIILRADIISKDDAEKFKKVFSEITSTAWIIYRSPSNFQRFSFSKKWICQHSKINKTKLESKRNAECKAKLQITIKNVTKDNVKKDVYLRQKPPLRSVIKIQMDHTHNTTSAEALRMLRVNDEVKECFFDYFSNGMTAAEAIRLHENNFLINEDFKSLANAAINPTINQVQYLHNCWRQANLGSLINPFEKLKEKIPLYEANGTTVHIHEDGDSWAIVLATSVMKRIQKSQFAKEMIFVDSTTGCEGLSSTMTILLAATKVGALPLCVLIHPSQTMESYFNAFDLVKKNFPRCFGGNDHPQIFMTDDSSAEKGALKRVWENSRQLLCQFHVAQAEWRWLFTHGIPKDERPRLMRLFQAVMYAASEYELVKARANILKEKQNFPDFVKRFSAFFNRKVEWVLFYRKDLLTRQNNTNNFAEISIRILKDIVLCRTKAFNVVALCEFCITVWELYLVKRLLDYAYARKHKPAILYSSLLRKSSNFSESDIEKTDDGTFKIKSGESTYVVNIDIGACSCPAGISGAFCKHQCFLMNLKKIKLPNAPPIMQEDRHELALLALGPKCPELAFFNNFQIAEEQENEKNVQEVSQLEPFEPEEQRRNQPMDSSEMDNEEHSMATPEQNALLKKEFERLASLASSGITSNGADRLLKIFKKIESVDDLKSLYVLKTIGQKTKRIKVQPTAVSRRQGLVKSCKKLPSGRPPLAGSKKCLKRKRQLSQNIIENSQNAKSHGTAH